MQKINFLILLNVLLLVSCAQSRPIGLLTDDYGIVTKEDLDEELVRANPSPFNTNDSSIFQYWMCYKPENYQITCEATGMVAPEYGKVGAFEFSVTAEGKTHVFGTRRNQNLGVCKKLEATIKKIFKENDVVCINASFLEKESETQYSWILDQVKAKKGEWSWFGKISK